MRKVLFPFLVLFLMSALAFGQALIPPQYQGLWQITAQLLNQDTIIPFENPIKIQVESNTITIIDDQTVVKHIDKITSEPYSDDAMDYIITFKDSKTEWDVLYIQGHYFLAVVDVKSQKAMIFVVEKVQINSPAVKSVWRNST